MEISENLNCKQERTQHLSRMAEEITHEVWGTAESGWMWYRIFADESIADTKPRDLLGHSSEVIQWSLISSFVLGVSRMLSKNSKDLSFQTLLSLIPSRPSDSHVQWYVTRWVSENFLNDHRRYDELTLAEIAIAEQAWQARISDCKAKLKSLQISAASLLRLRNCVIAHSDTKHAIGLHPIPRIQAEEIKAINTDFSELGHNIVSLATSTSIDTSTRAGYGLADDLLRRCKSHEDLHDLQRWSFHQPDDSEIARIVSWYGGCGVPSQAKDRSYLGGRINRPQPSHYQRD